jgi:hypothetical protein
MFQNKLYAVTEFADFGRIFVSNNEGIDWEHSENGTQQLGYFSILGTDDYMLTSSFGAGMYRSDDGLNWTQLTQEECLPSYPSEIIEHNGNIYTGAFGSNVDLYKSIDQGHSFDPLNVPGEGYIYALHVYQDKIYFGRTDAIYASEDDGNTWEQVGTSDSNNLFVKDIESFNSELYYSSNTLNRLNENMIWDQVELPDDYWVTSIKNIGDKLFIGTKESGILRMDEEGNFEFQNAGLPVGENGIYPRIVKFFSDNESMYVSTEMFGIFKAPIQDVGMNNPVSQNLQVQMDVYPNPFNPSTNIALNLSTETHIELNIYNIKGQKVKTIMKGNLNSGTHLIRWDGNNDETQKVSSGIYFLRLKSQQFESVTKMILLK